jgi:hypothetical protein
MHSHEAAGHNAKAHGGFYNDARATLKKKWLFSCPLLLLAVVFCIYRAKGLFVRSDSFEAYAFFNYAYGNFLATGEFPQWLPCAAYGSPAEPYAMTFLGSFQIVAIMVWALFHMDNAWNLFFLSAVLEVAVLVLGVTILSREIYHSPLAVVAVPAWVVFTAFWHVQIFWSHRVILYLPLLFYFILRFHNTGHFSFLWKAAAAGVFPLIGGLVYTAPVYVIAAMVFYLFLRLFCRGSARPDFRTIVSRPSYVAGLAFLAITCLYLVLSVHAFEGVRIVATGRHPTRGTVPLDVFLHYGGDALYKLPDFFLGLPCVHVEYFFYLGVAGTSLLLLACFGVRSGIFFSLLGTCIFLFLLALGPHGIVAYPAYFFPGMNRFRHLSYLLPMSRLILLFLAGFGLDWLAKPAGRQGWWRFAACLAATLTFFLVARPMMRVHGGDRWMRFIPEIGFAAAVAGLALAWTDDWRQRGLPALACAISVAFELGLSQYAHYASVGGYVKDGRFASPSLDIFAVQHPSFAPSRSPYRTITNGADAVTALAQRQIVNYATLPQMVGLDLCVPIFRVDFLTDGVFRLLDAADPTALQASNKELVPQLVLSAAHWQVALAKGWFRDACGCGGSKLVINPVGKKPHDVSSAVEHFSANRLVVAIDQEEPDGWLYYADAFHPGWRAFIDQIPVPVSLAREAFKAVPVPPGQHKVEFVFFDPVREWARRALGILSLATLFWFLGNALSRDPKDPVESRLG